ncbi:hypothetical protein R3P38DRAFT_2763493 [Favolaschia claudopus]|uniref:Uncharacterized protein n=1 Tax=Favolaschia claudopus TaxID=2862362 RepID=A0AAW0DFL2_9AGAR
MLRNDLTVLPVSLGAYLQVWCIQWTWNFKPAKFYSTFLYGGIILNSRKPNEVDYNLNGHTRNGGSRGIFVQSKEGVNLFGFRCQVRVKEHSAANGEMDRDLCSPSYCSNEQELWAKKGPDTRDFNLNLNVPSGIRIPPIRDLLKRKRRGIKVICILKVPVVDRENEVGSKDSSANREGLVHCPGGSLEGTPVVVKTDTVIDGREQIRPDTATSLLLCRRTPAHTPPAGSVQRWKLSTLLAACGLGRIIVLDALILSDFDGASLGLTTGFSKAINVLSSPRRRRHQHLSNGPRQQTSGYSDADVENLTDRKQQFEGRRAAAVQVPWIFLPNAKTSTFYSGNITAAPREIRLKRHMSTTEPAATPSNGHIWPLLDCRSLPVSPSSLRFVTLRLPSVVKIQYISYATNLIDPSPSFSFLSEFSLCVTAKVPVVRFHDNRLQKLVRQQRTAYLPVRYRGDIRGACRFRPDRLILGRHARAHDTIDRGPSSRRTTGVALRFDLARFPPPTVAEYAGMCFAGGAFWATAACLPIMPWSFRPLTHAPPRVLRFENGDTLDEWICSTRYIFFLCQGRGDARIAFRGEVLPSDYIRRCVFFLHATELSFASVLHHRRRHHCAFLITRTAVFFSRRRRRRPQMSSSACCISFLVRRPRTSPTLKHLAPHLYSGLSHPATSSTTVPALPLPYIHHHPRRGERRAVHADLPVSDYDKDCDSSGADDDGLWTTDFDEHIVPATAIRSCYPRRCSRLRGIFFSDLDERRSPGAALYAVTSVLKVTRASRGRFGKPLCIRLEHGGGNFGCGVSGPVGRIASASTAGNGILRRRLGGDQARGREHGRGGAIRFVRTWRGRRAVCFETAGDFCVPGGRLVPSPIGLQDLVYGVEYGDSAGVGGCGMVKGKKRKRAYEEKEDGETGVKGSRHAALKRQASMCKRWQPVVGLSTTMPLRLDEGKGNKKVVERRDAGANAMNVDGGTARLTSGKRYQIFVSLRFLPRAIHIATAATACLPYESSFNTPALARTLLEQNIISVTAIVSALDSAQCLMPTALVSHFRCRPSPVHPLHTVPPPSIPLKPFEAGSAMTTRPRPPSPPIAAAGKKWEHLLGVDGRVFGACMEVEKNFVHFDGVCGRRAADVLQSCCRRAAARAEIIAFWSAFCGAETIAYGAAFCPPKVIQFLLYSGSLSAPQFLLFTVMPKGIQNTIAWLTETFNFAVCVGTK